MTQLILIRCPTKLEDETQSKSSSDVHHSTHLPPQENAILEEIEQGLNGLWAS